MQLVTIPLDALSTDELIMESERLVEEIQALAEHADVLANTHHVLVVEIARRQGD